MKAFRRGASSNHAFASSRCSRRAGSQARLTAELRQKNYSENDPSDDRPFSGKRLPRYRRAQPHGSAATRSAPARPTRSSAGVGRSQIWYGGGGPPSYAWIRLGSDGRATVVTAMQDIGTARRRRWRRSPPRSLDPARARDRVAGDWRAAPTRDPAGSTDDAVDGPAVPPRRRERQVIETPRSASREEALHRGRQVVSPTASSRRSRRSSGSSRARRSSGRARGPNPTGMQVLTPVQVAEVAVDTTGEIWVDARGRARRRRVTTLGASSQIEGGIIQGIGHTLDERCTIRDGQILTTASMPTSCRRSPTCRRSSASSSTSPTRTLTNPGRRARRAPRSS